MRDKQSLCYFNAMVESEIIPFIPILKFSGSDAYKSAANVDISSHL